MVKTVPGGDASNRFAYSWKCRSANARSRHSLTIPKGMRHRTIAATDRTPFGLPLLTSQASVHAKASIGKNQYRRPFLRKLQPLPGWNLADRRRGKERRAQDQNCEAHEQLEFKGPLEECVDYQGHSGRCHQHGPRDTRMTQPIPAHQRP